MFTLPDSSYYGTKTILSVRASLRHKNSDFDAISVKERNCAALQDLESGASHIRKALVHTMVQCDQILVGPWRK